MRALNAIAPLAGLAMIPLVLAMKPATRYTCGEIWASPFNPTSVSAYSTDNIYSFQVKNTTADSIEITNWNPSGTGNIVSLGTPTNAVPFWLRTGETIDFQVYLDAGAARLKNTVTASPLTSTCSGWTVPSGKSGTSSFSIS